MGGLINSIFGGGSNKANSKAIDFMKDVYKENKALATPWATGGLNMYNAYNSFLSGEGQEEAFQKYLDSGDYKFTTQQGMEAINQNMAAKGLLNSGSTLKALTQWGQQNAMQYRENYMNRLLQSAGVGAGVLGNLMGASNNSAQMLGQQYSNKANQAANGVGNFLNFGLGVASLISDERLKKDKKRIGAIKVDGKKIGVHAYRYKGENDDVQPHIGVMAQEVAKKVPRALGPKIGNYLTVDYKELLHA